MKKKRNANKRNSKKGKKLGSLIGVIHLQPLPGSPRSSHEDPHSVLQRVGYAAVQEADAFSRAGFSGILLENYGDAPYYSNRVAPETVSSLSVIAAAVREISRIPVGINLLRNDGRSALAVASVTGCSFIRLNVLGGVAATDQGFIEGEAAFLMRERRRYHSEVSLYADVHVKHAKTLSSDDYEQALRDTAFRSLADGLILTGSATGKAFSLETLRELKPVADSIDKPVFVGSGVTLDQVPEIRDLGYGVIVSSALRVGNRAGATLELKKVRGFAKEFFR